MEGQNNMVITDEMKENFKATLPGMRAAVTQMPVSQFGCNCEIREKKEIVVEETGLNTRVILYYPQGEGPFPVVFSFSGGGFVYTILSQMEGQSRYICHDNSYVVAVVDYVWAPEHEWPTANEECYTVIKHFVENAEALNIDATKMAVMGGSSGGNIAAEMCIMSAQRKDFKLSHCSIFFGKLDLVGDGMKYATPYTDANYASPEFAAFTLGNFAMYGSQENLKDPLASPMYADVNQFPPTLIIAGMRDIMCKENQAFAEKLIDAGIEVTLKIFPDQTHGFLFLADTSETVCQNVREIINSELKSAFAK